MASEIDWDAIERDYRAGIKTIREIAAEHNITHGYVNKRAKQYDWGRDLSARIKQKADELVSKSIVAAKVSKATEQEIIQTVAELQAAVLLNERADITRLSVIAEKLEEELESSKDDLDKRTRILKSLVETREKLINLRRRNFNINDNSNGEANRSEVKEVRYTVIDSVCTHIEP